MSLINKKFYGALGNEPRRAEDDSPFDALMHHLCVDMGFCGGMVDGVPMHVTDPLPVRGVVTADSFADLVMRADGVSCAEHPHLWRAIRDAFCTYMGADAVERPLLEYACVRSAPER